MNNVPYQRAMVVKSSNLNNIGKPVTILERADFTDEAVGTKEDRFGVTWERGSTETIWIVKSLGVPFYFQDGEYNRRGVHTNIAYFPDSFLAPFPDEDDCMEDLIDYVDLDQKKDVARDKAISFFMSLRKENE